MLRIKRAVRLFAFLFLAAVLSPLRAQQPEIELLVNQAGYDTAGVKRVWAQTSFFTDRLDGFEIVRDDEVVHTGSWTQETPVWGRWYAVGPGMPRLGHRGQSLRDLYDVGGGITASFPVPSPVRTNSQWIGWQSPRSH